MSTILLDFDGTLTDSAPGILASYRTMLRALGHEPDPTIDLGFVIGPALDDVMPLVLAPYGETRVEEAVTIYREDYGRAGMFGSTLYEGVPAMLETLRGAGHRLFVATAKRTVFARPMLERLGVASLFAGIYGSEPGGAIDHKPELIGQIIAKEGLVPAETTMVGDRRYDIAGAHANGLRGFGVLWGYGTREELEQAGADALFETIPALTAALLEGRRSVSAE